MVRVQTTAPSEDAASAATAPATPAATEPPQQDALGDAPREEDTQPPPTSAAPNDAGAPSEDGVSARKVVAQDAGADHNKDSADEDAVTPAVVDVEVPRAPNAPAGDEPAPFDDEEEFSLAGGDESTPSTALETAAVTEDPLATAQPVTEKPAQEPLSDEATVTPSPSPGIEVAEIATTAPPPPITTAPATTKPLLRTDTAAVVSDSSALHSRLNQGSPLLLISFAVICCGFLILWVRKRKISGSGSSSSDGGGSSKIASKVQYSRIENKKESPFEEDDEDEDDDRDGNWDDWEGDMGRLADEPHVSTNAYQSSLYANPNPFAASMSPPMSPELVAQSAPQFQFAAPSRLPAPGHDYQQQQQPRGSSDLMLHEIVVSTGATATTSTTSGGQKASSPGSNSSSDSYEVVTDDPVLLHSSPFTSSKKSPPRQTEDAEKQTEDDLFSQFGMVPTFRKSTAAPPVPSFMQTPSSSSSSSHRHTTASVAAPVSAAAASALFAAEMEDLSIGAGSDEWGEDDEWVQGI